MTTTPQLSVRRALEDGWAALLRSFVPWLLGVIAAAAVVVVSALLCFVPVLFVGPLIGWGMTRFHLAALDGAPPASEFFRGFDAPAPRWLASMGAALLVGLATMPAVLLWAPFVLVASLTEGDGSAEALLVFFAVFPLYLAWILTIAVRLAFVMHAVVDLGCGPVDALRESWSRTRGQTLPMVGLVLLTNLVLPLLGALLCGVGQIPAALVGQVALASAWRQLGPSFATSPGVST